MVNCKNNKKSGPWRGEVYKQVNNEEMATERVLSLALSFLADKAKWEHHMLYGSGYGQKMLTSSAGESKLVLALNL